MLISSLLDTDLYKFTMMQAVLHQFPGTEVTYRFKCRNADVSLGHLADRVRAEIDNLASLSFSEDELQWLGQLRFIKSDFVDFLGLFRLNPKYVTVTGEPGSDLEIEITGPWLHTIMFEIPILAIVNELYFQEFTSTATTEEGRSRLVAKIEKLQAPELSNLKIADYGTRRRFSKEWQREVLTTLQNRLGLIPQGQFAGTSNVLLAKELGLTPLGTMAHEYLQACQALGPRLRDSQTFAFESWAKEYRGDLGIALSDVYGIEPFLRDFDLYFCKLFDGARHDSGDPFVWGERMIKHYQDNRVDPKTKTLIFSDSLTVDKTIELYERFHDRCELAFGIGTNLTNDVGFTPLQIVIKMTQCNGQPVAKISDTPDKNMCEDENYLSYLKQVFEIPAK